jgi:putative effector of murein hydrolase LrgA (UPF0299 family)
MYAMIWLIVILAIYFVPTIVASARHHRQMNSIVVLNTFLGWTFVGWVVALIWAVSAFDKPETEKS